MYNSIIVIYAPLLSYVCLFYAVSVEGLVNPSVKWVLEAVYDASVGII